jgi:hypothetical protein
MKAPKLDLINFDPSKNYLISPGKLAMWAKYRKNVLFIGETGVGKTAIILSFFEQLGLRCKYFSAPTLEPYIDIIGVPREHTDENGNTFLEFIQKKEFAQDEIDVVFFDEFNRARAEVRNAVMEFVQLKSINGKKYNNLQMIWAAINPYDEDGTYDVDRLDPAMMGRFPIKCYVKNEPCAAFFEATFGEFIGAEAIQWWDGLTAAQKALVPPRTLHDAVEWYLLSGDIRDVIPDTSVLVDKLVSILSSDPIEVQIDKIVANKDKVAAEAFLKDANKLFRAQAAIEQKEENMNFMLPLARPEVLSDWASKSGVILDFLVKHIDIGTNQDIVESFIRNQPDLVPAIKKAWMTTEFIKQPGYRMLTENIVNDINLSCSNFYVKEGSGLNYSFSERLIAIKVKTNGFNYSSGEERLSSWKAFLVYVPKSLTKDDCIAGLNVMETLAKDNSGFLMESDEVKAVFNTLTSNLYFQYGLDANEIWGLCPNMQASHLASASARHQKAMFLK